MGKIDFSKVSTPELGVFLSKLSIYIQDIDKGLLKLDALRDQKEITPTFNVSEYGQKMFEKSKEAKQVHDSINIELEKRAAKKINFKFEYSEISKISHNIDQSYYDFFDKKNKETVLQKEQK